MPFDVFDGAPNDLPSRDKWRWGQVAELTPGQRLRIPYSFFDSNTNDPGHIVRNVAYQYGKRLRRKYRTHKDKQYLWIIRIA